MHSRLLKNCRTYLLAFTIFMGVACLFGCSGAQTMKNADSILPDSASSVGTVRETPVPSTEPVTVHINYVLPNLVTRSAARISSYKRFTNYISTSNSLITVGVTPLGGTTTHFGPSGCTTSSCPINFTTVPGPTNLTLTLTDSVGTVLSKYSVLKIIQPQILNTLNFSSNPVAASASLTLASASVSSGTPTKVPLTLNVMDADGNVIIGNSPYVDSTGPPVTFSLSVSNNQAGGHGTVVIQGPPLITAPTQSTIFAAYDGNWLASSTISIASSSPAITSLTGTTLSTIPTAYENMLTGLTNPYIIITGSDGALWFGNSGASAVGRLTLNGIYTSHPAGNTPYSVVTGADGNIYAGNQGNNTITKYTRSGATFTFATSNSPYNLAAGMDGNFWYITHFYVGRVTPNGIETNVVPGGLTNDANWITPGHDDAMWIAQNGRVGRVDFNGKVTEFTPPNCGTTSDFWSIAEGPDGNFWFTERDTGCIGVSGTGPVCISTGPDGAMWFAESNTDAIGRITMSGVVTSYTTGISAGASPQCLTTGPDGNIWFSEWSAGKVGKFVL
jgi:streptogramin lyase